MSESREGPYKWFIVVFALLLGTQMTINNNAFSVLLDEFIVTYQLPQAVLGILTAVKCSVTAVISTLSGSLVHKYGCRPVAMVGIVITVLSNVLSFFATNFFSLTITFGILQGVGLGCFDVPINAIVQQHFRKGKRSLAAGLASCGKAAGMLIVGPITRLFMDVYGWRGTMLMLAAVSAQCMLAAAMLRPPADMEMHVLDNKHAYRTKNIGSGERCTGEKDSAGSNYKGSKSKDPSEIPHVNKKHMHVDYEQPKSHIIKTKLSVICSCFDRKLIGKPEFLLLFLASMPTAFGQFTSRFYSIQRAIHQGIQPSQAAFIFTAYGLGSILGRVGGGCIADMRCTVRSLYYSLCILISGLVVIMSFTIHLLPSIIPHIVFGVVIGMIIGCYLGVESTVLVDIVGLPLLPKAMGLLQLPRVGTSFIAVPMAGLLYDVYGDYTASYIMSGGVQCLGGLLALAAAILHLHKSNLQE